MVASTSRAERRSRNQGACVVAAVYAEQSIMGVKGRRSVCVCVCEVGLIGCEEGRSGTWGAGCGGCALFRFCPLHRCTVGTVACMHAYVWDVFIYLFFTLLCNAGCDLGNNISQRDVGRELCDHFNLCVILDCTATSHRHSTINSAFFSCCF